MLDPRGRGDGLRRLREGVRRGGRVCERPPLQRSPLQYLKCTNAELGLASPASPGDRKSTRLNSSHSQISYAVFCLKKKITNAFPVAVATLYVINVTSAV